MDHYIDSLISEGRSVADILESFLLDESVKEKRLEIAEFLKSQGVPEEDVERLSSQIIDIDPTTRSGKHEYVDQILKWYSDGKVVLPEDYETTKQAVKNFFKMQKKMPLLRDKSIEDFSSPGEIQKLIDSGKKKTKKQNRTESFEPVASSGGYQIWKVNEEHKEPFCKLAQGTQWCVKDPEYFDEYGVPYYYIAKGGNPHALLHVGSQQFKDVYDEAITPNMDEDLRILIRSNIEIPLNFDGNTPVGDLLALYSKKEVLRTRDWETIAKYAVELPERWLEVEDWIAKDEWYSMEYAEKVMKGPFPAGEPAIATHPRLSYRYAEEILKGRFKAGEARIIENGEMIFPYTMSIVKGPWPEAEEEILEGSASFIRIYAEKCLKARWPEGEKALIKKGVFDTSDLSKYAQSVIQGPWPEAEPLIMKGMFSKGGPQAAVDYAINVLKKPWDVFEEYVGLLKTVDPEEYKRYMEFSKKF